MSTKTRVAAGVAELDEYFGDRDWAIYIDVDRLKMSDTQHCVLAQAFDSDYYVACRQMHLATSMNDTSVLSNTSYEYAIAHGFTVRNSAALMGAFGRLNREWNRVIRERWKRPIDSVSSTA